MKRRDVMRSATVTSVGALVGLAGLRQFSYGATTVTGSNKTGGWWPPAPPTSQPWQNWPLIPLHAVLLGDGRVLTYGTNSGRQPTGYFIYDVWDSGYDASNPGLSPQVPDLSPGSHLTLPNNTGTDIFCSAQIVLPRSGDSGEVFVAGGDTWDGAKVTNIGNNNSNIF